MDIHVLIAQMIQFFLIMFCGSGLFKLGILNPEVDSHLTRLVVNVTMPLIILNSVLTRTEADDSSRVITVFLASLVIYLLLPLVSFAVVKLFHLPQNQQGVYAFMNTYSNVGFMGFPMITALYGEQALLYAAVLNILFNLSAYSIGVWMMHYGSGKKSGLSLKAILNPGMIGSILALLLYFFPVQVPAPVTGAIGSIGGLTSPLAMLLIGANLAGMPFREMFNDWKVYIFTALKQLLVPILIWPLLCLTISDAYIRGIIFVLLSMPVGNTVVLFATQYKKDQVLATKGVFITTLFSLVSIPLVFTILHIA